METASSTGGVEEPPKKSFLLRAASWTWEKGTDLFFNVLTLGRWNKYKKTEGGREAFMLAWFFSDKVTWAQAFVVFKWPWVKAVVFPALKAAWAKVTSAAIVTLEVLNLA